jgi:hypothetical protein
LSQTDGDKIMWKWSPNGEYTARSAYQIQFNGSHPPFQVGKLWKAKTESKVKVFGWTTLHQKILTVDNLTSRGIQHNPLCPLFHLYPEDARHLLINCSYTREVLRLIWSWLHLGGAPSFCLQDQDLADWLPSNASKAGAGESCLEGGGVE